ncbi:MAG: CotH kinase family protein [Bacteroidales bacterium]|nr:CotH kinase family protein [Bacteroidales bacterium]
MKKFFTTLLVTAISLPSFAQEWIDVTDSYVTNPRFDDNDIKTGWIGTTFSANNPVGNAEHYNKNYDTYQKLSGLPAGKYRVSLNAFYRMGSASNDFSLYDSKNYSGSQNAKLYAKSSAGEKTASIVPASSAALEESLGGKSAEVSNNSGWWWWNTAYYLPDDMEAAHYWFEAGKYKNSLECNVKDDGELTIGVRKSTKINNDWTCLDNWKLEFWGTVSNLSMPEEELSLLPHEIRQITVTAKPYDVIYNNLKWMSSNRNVATVNENGEITATGEGFCYITAISKANSSVNTRCKVTVKANEDIAKAIVINEIMAANVDVYLDPSFNYGSWVELYNPSEMNLSLGGLYITDDPDNLKKHRLIDDYGLLAAKGYALLNFDHFEIFKAASYRQIDDKLNCDGGEIIISDGKNIITRQEYPAAISRISYARTIDGGNVWSFTGNPSPGISNQSNGGFAKTQLEAPYIDKDAQVFEGSLQVCVNIPPSTTLRYTTDGTAPTLTNGKTSSTGLFTVKSTTCYRFRLFRNGALPSPVVTRTYIYKDKTYPFPIISVVTDDRNLNSTEYGVFKEGPNGRSGRGSENDCNWNMSWDRPVSFEYITTDNECVISQECDLSMCGGWSRSWSPHSFKLKASKTYDFQNFFAAQLFDKKPYIKSKTLQIRNGGNNVLTYGEIGGRIRDAILQQVVARSGINIDYQEWQPVHVLINGKYYATLSMREPNNKHYAYANHGIDTDEMEQFEMDADSGYVQMEGTDEAWLHLIDLSKTAANEDSYTEIRQMLDIDEYINLMATEFYLGGTDWPHNNVKGFRDVNNGKFRFVLFDLDFAGQTTTPIQDFFNKEKFQSEHELMGYDYSQSKSLNGTKRSSQNTFVTLFKNLLKNSQFRKQFIDTYCIIGGSVMQPKYVKEIANEMKNYIQKGIYSEDQFDPSLSSNYVIKTFTTSWNSNMIDHMRKRSEMGISTVEKQSVSLSANAPGAKLSLNGLNLPYAEFNGYLFAPIRLKATAPAGYRFAGWKDATKTGSEYISTDSEYTLPTSGSQKLIAVFEEITKEEMLAEGITPIRINEVSAANSMYINDYFKKNDWIELHNTTAEDIDIAGMYISDNADKPRKYQVPSDNTALNTIIPANGFKVIWCDKLDNIGADIHTSFKLAAEGGDVLITTEDYADTLTYAPHSGTQTFGRYPDGANDTYVMNAPTIAKSNMICSYDTVFIVPVNPEPNSIRSYIKEGGIAIAYADGALNVKSEEAPIKSVAIYSVTGTRMPAKAIMRNGGRFATVSLEALPKGIYMAKAATKDGDECHIKFAINTH